MKLHSIAQDLFELLSDLVSSRKFVIIILAEASIERCSAEKNVLQEDIWH